MENPFAKTIDMVSLAEQLCRPRSTVMDILLRTEREHVPELLRPNLEDIRTTYFVINCSCGWWKDSSNAEMVGMAWDKHFEDELRKANR